MTNSTKTTLTADWTWADELFNSSDWADDFEVEETDFNPDTGIHYYIDEACMVIAVTPDGDVVLEDQA